MTTDGLLAAVRARLEAQSSDQFRRVMQGFSREPLNSYGVPAPQLKELARACYQEVKTWPLAKRNQFCNQLWKSGRDEEGTLAVYLYHRFARQCASCEFHLFEKWIDRHVRNWGHCDGIAYYLLAAAIQNEPELTQLLVPRTGSPNRWKRRAAAVALVKEAKAGRQTVRVLNISERLLADSDDLVRKGVGWLLKEAYPKRPREVMEFLRAHAATAPRLVLRIAAEKMAYRDRLQVL